MEVSFTFSNSKVKTISGNYIMGTAQIKIVLFASQIVNIKGFIDIVNIF